MPPAPTTRDRILRRLLDINRHSPQSFSPLRLGRARPNHLQTNRHSPKLALVLETGATPSWVYEVLGELQGRGWLSRDHPLTVTNPHAIFQWWKDRRAMPKISSFQVKDPKMVAHQLLAEHSIPNAATTYYGENQHHGHLFPRRMDTYVRLENFAKAREALLALGGQLGGTNFRLWTGDDAVVEERQPGAPGPMNLDFAPVPQIILDLYLEGGSAAEAADLMIQKEFIHAKPGL